MNNFKHRTPVQVRFKDFDKMAHINNANYLTYVEMARLKYFEDVLGPIDWSQQEGIILARIEIDYKLPVLYDDKIAVYSRCSSIGRKSLQLRFAIVRYKNESDTNEEIVAEGLTVLVCYNYIEQASMEVSPERKQMLQRFEGVHFF